MAQLKEVGVSKLRLMAAFMRNVNERVGDIDLEIGALPSDIPTVATSYYVPEGDDYVILFTSRGTQGLAEKKLSQQVWLYLEPGNMRIVGFGVNGLREHGASQTYESITASLNEYEHVLKENLAQAKSWNEKLRMAGLFSIEKRKLRFFASEAPRALHQLEQGINERRSVVGAGVPF